MRRLSLTSWSVHRSLSDGSLTLLDLPAKMQQAGIGTLEICHFHFPSTDDDYIASLKAALAAAKVESFSILIDMGDISSADAEQRTSDLQSIKHWIDIASKLGSQVVRVVAGEADPNDQAALQRSIAGLAEAAEHAQSKGVKVLTENFKALASTAENCHAILDALDGKVGLCADIGNFPSDIRVASFRSVIGRASVVHVKASYSETNELDAEQVRACLQASVEAGFDGPYTLVYDRDANSWPRIAELQAVASDYL
jgi:sugar phosphate isomerase/epimerase